MKKSRFPSMRHLALGGLIVGALLSIILQIWFKPNVNSKEAPPELMGILLPFAHPLKPFQLTDHNGTVFDLERLQGRWTFLFFGYTHCPDVCPVALGVLGETFGHLSSQTNGQLNEKPKPQGVFVSVDPKRDTLPLLKSYVPYFNEGFIGVTGGSDTLLLFSKQVGAHYSLPPEADQLDSYAVDHTSAFFLLDPKARLVALFYPNRLSGEQIAQRFNLIQKRYQEGLIP